VSIPIKLKHLADELDQEAKNLRKVAYEPPRTAKSGNWRRVCIASAEAKEDAARRIRLAE